LLLKTNSSWEWSFYWNKSITFETKKMDLTQEEWSSKLASDNKAYLLDVRTPEEFEEGHVPNATMLDIRQPESFMEGVQSMDSSKHYYIYCRSGARSAQACQVMNQMGIENTYNLLGGFMEWEGDTA
jgi:rhodanese-related sulfurtransferase